MIEIIISKNEEEGGLINKYNMEDGQGTDTWMGPKTLP